MKESAIVMGDFIFETGANRIKWHGGVTLCTKIIDFKLSNWYVLGNPLCNDFNDLEDYLPNRVKVFQLL